MARAKRRTTSLEDRYLTLGDRHQRDPLLSVLKESRQYDVKVRSIHKRELVDLEGHELADFASCNYISMDQDVKVLLKAGAAATKKFGIHSGRARLMGTHSLMVHVEQKIARFLGGEDAVFFPTSTLASIGIIPALALEGDAIFLDKSAHATMYQAAQMARDKGAALLSYEQGDLTRLEDLLKANRKRRRKLICVDGVYSMTGDYANLPELVPLAKKYDALVYVDDGHGLAFVGQKPTKAMPYGFKGNGLVRHYGMSYDQLLYVAGVSKGFAAAAGFALVSPRMKEFLLAYAKPLDYTQPPTPFALGVLDAALDLQLEVGDKRRAKVYALCERLISGLRAQGFHVMNRTHFPIVSVWAGNTEKLIEASRRLYRDGIFLTSCPYPTMPRGQEALRVTVSSNNS